MKLILAFYVILGSCLLSCSKNSATTGLPLLTPPVKAAAPKGFQSRMQTGGLGTEEFSSRFFTTGPTSLFGILTDIDSRITDINSRSPSSKSTCLHATPTAYTLTAWGQSVTMYAQCYEVLDGATAADPKLIQWGVKDNVTYLYVAVGAGRVAVTATPIPGVTDQYRVRGYLSVGVTNTDNGEWDAMSYGVIQIDADSNANTFEMSVAGMGIGYCGAQLKSDGTNVYALGSTDMTATCLTPPDDLCVTAANVANPGTCSPAFKNFTVPALGRKPTGKNGGGGWAAHPVTANVQLDGNSNDDVHFGPTSPTSGVTEF